MAAAPRSIRTRATAASSSFSATDGRSGSRRSSRHRCAPRRTRWSCPTRPRAARGMAACSCRRPRPSSRRTASPSASGSSSRSRPPCRSRTSPTSRPTSATRSAAAALTASCRPTTPSRAPPMRSTAGCDAWRRRAARPPSASTRPTAPCGRPTRATAPRASRNAFRRRRLHISTLPRRLTTEAATPAPRPRATRRAASIPMSLFATASAPR
mmetsp:Transcript_52284/g.113944  ORF Transcript_52284/g.113944 Transcript_52284/m.113944 type:complete len:212 (-) Transcript_52284:314-949(-)